MDLSHYRQYEPIFGSWHIVKTIGAGSFGTVFLIEREDFGVRYQAALKVITVPTSHNEELEMRATGMDENSIRDYFSSCITDLGKEIALMSKLKGTSHIVSYENHQVFPHENGVGADILIQMELLTPLNQYLLQHPLDRNEALRMGIHLCEALELCEKYQIIHRDIKPENIFISPNGDYKLGDFGVARTVEKSLGASTKSGTISYMAPEVYRGEAYGATVDLYSLGLVLYRVFNDNREPFMPMAPNPITPRDRENSLMRRLQGEELPRPSHADPAVTEILRKACAFDAKDRYQSAAQMRTDLENAWNRNPAGAAKIEDSDLEQAVQNEPYVREATASDSKMDCTISDMQSFNDRTISDTQPFDERTISDTQPLDERTISDVQSFNDRTISDTQPVGGRTVSNAQPVKERTPTVAPHTTTTTWKTQEKPSKKPIIWIVAAAVVLLLVILVSNSGDKEQPELTEPIATEPITMESIVTEPDLNTVIEWADPAVEEAIRNGLDKPTGPIYKKDVQAITGLNFRTLPVQDLSDLSPLNGLTNLQTICLDFTAVNDLTPLSSLTKLQNLSLISTAASDLSPLSGLTNLEILNINTTAVSDLSPLSGLTNLKVLNIRATAVNDLSPLSGLTNLEILNADSTAVSDLSPLSGLTNLEVLNISATAVSDLSLLSGLTELSTLSINATDVSNLSPLSNMTKLEFLEVGHTAVSDLSPLSNKTELLWLDFDHTAVSNLSPLSGLTNLETLYLGHTSVNDLSPLSGLTSLKTLHSNRTDVSDLSPLSSLINLEDLDLDFTAVSDLSPLSNLKNLQHLSVSDCPITDFTPIKNIPAGKYFK